MPLWAWILIVVAIVAVLLLAARSAARSVHSERLRRDFGPEYDRTVETTSGRREAEAGARRPAGSAGRSSTSGRSIRQPVSSTRAWTATQGRFVDEPAEAVREADVLVIAGHAGARLPDGGVRGTVGGRVGRPPGRRRELPRGARHRDGERARPGEHRGPPPGDGPLPGPVPGPARGRANGCGRHDDERAQERYKDEERIQDCERNRTRSGAGGDRVSTSAGRRNGRPDPPAGGYRRTRAMGRRPSDEARLARRSRRRRDAPERRRSRTTGRRCCPRPTSTRFRSDWEPVQVGIRRRAREAVAAGRPARGRAHAGDRGEGSPRPAPRSRPSGTAARTSPPRTSASPSSGTGRSSSGSWPRRRGRRGAGSASGRPVDSERDPGSHRAGGRGPSAFSVRSVRSNPSRVPSRAGVARAGAVPARRRPPCGRPCRPCRRARGRTRPPCPSPRSSCRTAR